MAEDQIIHTLVPIHEKISDNEKATLFKRYSITVKELPKISINDAAIQHLNVVAGDIIKITRPSETAGKVVYYRGVSNE